MEEGLATMRTCCLRGGVGVTFAVLALSSCGTPAPSPTAAARLTPTPLPRPSAAAGPCASVQTTTAIDQVPAACAALWAPYGVTKVPPANLTDSTPAPPPVANATNGAVSDADAQSWALASNRGAVWYRWAEANDQPGILGRLGNVSLVPSAEIEALNAKGTVSQPDCAIFPTRVALFEISPDDKRFFSSLGQVIDVSASLVATYPGPCTISTTSSTGQTRPIASYSSTGTTFFAGSIQEDPLLGKVWFTVGASNCGVRGAPTAWCR